jgi:chromosome segregation ATPase
VDDQGNVHYSDSLPPHVAKERQKREVKSESGMTKEVIDPPTEAELEQRRQKRLEAKRELERQRREQEKQAERDRRLKRMYTSVSDIKQTRDERLQAIDGQIKARKRRIQGTQERLQKRRQEAARLERSNQGNPDKIYDVIDRLERSVEGHQEFIRQKKQQKKQLRARYRSDIERFQELQSQQRASNR